MSWPAPVTPCVGPGADGRSGTRCAPNQGPDQTVVQHPVPPTGARDRPLWNTAFHNGASAPSVGGTPRSTTAHLHSPLVAHRVPQRPRAPTRGGTPRSGNRRPGLARRHPTMARLVATGIPLLGDGGADVRRHCADALERGPGPVSEADLELMRYGLTDLLDDLAHVRPGPETTATAVGLSRAAAELALAAAATWNGTGKWLARGLESLDERQGTQVAADLDQALRPCPRRRPPGAGLGGRCGARRLRWSLPRRAPPGGGPAGHLKSRTALAWRARAPFVASGHGLGGCGHLDEKVANRDPARGRVRRNLTQEPRRLPRSQATTPAGLSAPAPGDEEDQCEPRRES